MKLVIALVLVVLTGCVAYVPPPGIDVEIRPYGGDGHHRHHRHRGHHHHHFHP